MNQIVAVRSFDPTPPWSLSELTSLGVLATVCAFLVDDWIAVPAIVVFWLAWKYLRDEDGLPILGMAITFQWMQVTIGMWYHAATGHELATMVLSDYRPMMLIGLGCVASLITGLATGRAILRRSHGPERPHPAHLPIGWGGLSMLYIAVIATQGAVQNLAYDFPDLTQAILSFRFLHLGVLFIILRRLSRPVLQWHLIALLMTVEVVLGLTGFFAGFREPLIMVVAALVEVFDTKRLQHWLFAVAAAATMISLSVLWIGVRGEYRASFDSETFAASKGAQINKMAALSERWMARDEVVDDTDRLVDRLWVIYYPALAVSRVPAVLPHTNGSIMWSALQHVFNPRVFFPDKAVLQSDSEMVRKYSGVHVAGVEQDTSIAFGYAAESYIDFGLPWMFVPVFLYGVAAGVAYQFLSRRVANDEIRVGLLAVVFWLTLYLFERSWVKTLGLFGTLMLYLAVPALLLDYYLAGHQTCTGAEPEAVSAPAHEWTR